MLVRFLAGQAEQIAYPARQRDQDGHPYWQVARLDVMPLTLDWTGYLGSATIASVALELSACTASNVDVNPRTMTALLTFGAGEGWADMLATMTSSAGAKRLERLRFLVV